MFGEQASTTDREGQANINKSTYIKYAVTELCNMNIRVLMTIVR